MKVAIIDGLSTGKYLARELLAKGAECYHVFSRNDFPEFALRTFESDNYMHEFGYVKDDERLSDLLRTSSVDRLVAGSEPGVELVDTLNTKLRLPGNEPDTADSRRDKWKMAQRLQESNLDYPHGAQVFSPEEAAEWYLKNNLEDAVVKPVRSAGADGVAYCQSPQQAQDAVAAILQQTNIFDEPNQGALIQENLAGPEYIVNTVSVDGEHRIVESWRVHHVSDINTPVFSYHEPTDPRLSHIQQLHAYVKEVLTALGIRNAAGHSEVRFTRRGPVLLETGARLGGANIPDVVRKFTGTSQASAFADVITAPKSIHDIAEPAGRDIMPMRVVGLVNRFAGHVRSADWEDRLHSLNTAAGLHAGLEVGQYAPLTRDLNTGPGWIYLVSEDESAIEADFATIRRWESEPFYTV
ncbi:MAG: ATP-grasp domain-containing protein [Corynebacteriales bacterium]|nr:ATP-grasp domain-containing protein [Mycobacteriales bacterium]